MTAGSARTSSGVPSAIFLPKLSTTTRSQMPITKGMSWSTSEQADAESSASGVMAFASSARRTSLKPAGRLVEEEDARIERNRARGRDHAPLAEGELNRQAVEVVREAEAVRPPRHASPRERVARRPRRARGSARSRGRSFVICMFSSTLTSSKRSERLPRAHEASVDAPVRRHSRVRSARRRADTLPLAERTKPREGVDERRLAGAVGADQADDLAWRDRQRDVVDGRDAAEADCQVAHLEGPCGDALRHARLALDRERRGIARRCAEERCAGGSGSAVPRGLGLPPGHLLLVDRAGHAVGVEDQVEDQRDAAEEQRPGAREAEPVSKACGKSASVASSAARRTRRRPS